MSSAGQSWYPLSGWDPVPGDPVAVRAAGEDYEQVAVQIQVASVTLRRVADGFTQRSEAVDEVQAKARRLADQIERAYGRYTAAGAALVTYAGGLAQAQQIAQDALRQAQSAAAAQDNAQQDLNYWSARSNEALTGGPANNFSSQADATRATLMMLDGHLAAARATLETATAMRDAAADAATASVTSVVAADDLHDTVGQDILGTVEETWTGLGAIAAKLSMLALVLCWVPGVGEVLGAADIIVATLLLVRDSIALASGNGSKKNVALDVLGVMTFGVGRVAVKGLNMAADGARASKGLRSGATVAKDTGAATRTSGKAAATGISDEVPLQSAVEAQAPPRFAQTKELLGVLSPPRVFADTLSDLGGGGRIFQVRGTVHGAHVSGVPDNIMLERVNELRNTDKVGRYFYVVGQHDVARDASFLARNQAFDTPGLVSLRGVVGAKVGAAALSTYNYGQIGK